MWRESGFVGVGAPMSAWPPLAESRPCGEGQPTERDNHSAHVSALASKASQVNWCWVQYNWCEGRIPMIWHRQSLELKHVKSPRKRVKIETGTWWHHTVHIPHNEKRNLVQGPLHRKQIVNFMDINHVSEIVFLLAVAASFSVGFHNIGRHCHSIDRESHEVGLSKCHQKCLHPGIFSTASQDQKKFIVQPAHQSPDSVFFPIHIVFSMAIDWLSGGIENKNSEIFQHPKWAQFIRICCIGNITIEKKKNGKWIF